MKKFLALSIISFSSIIAHAESYKLDESHTTIGFKVKHLVISTVTGRFNKFEGSGNFDEKTKTLKDLKATIQVSSIDTNESDRDKHLKSPEFFNADKFPTITAEIKSANFAKADDDSLKLRLKIRDVTKDVDFVAKFLGTVTDPWGNKRIAFEGKGKVNRKDFGVSWNKTLDKGGVMVDDMVEIFIEGEAIAEAKK
ncbi:MAG: YceI family protein [Bacteriovoracia bacterium]